jgi:phosphate starvation-inducible membrane PsiE
MSSPDNLIKQINANILNPVIGLMIAFALVFFLYGLVEFISGAANEEKREQGKRHIIWGIIGLFIMLGVNGLLKIVENFWK